MKTSSSKIQSSPTILGGEDITKTDGFADQEATNIFINSFNSEDAIIDIFSKSILKYSQNDLFRSIQEDNKELFLAFYKLRLAGYLRLLGKLRLGSWLDDIEDNAIGVLQKKGVDEMGILKIAKIDDEAFQLPHHFGNRVSKIID